jgi:sec-independent protein translocase protein TatB
MEVLGIGPSELVFVVIIALIVLGPKDMQKAGRSIGKWLRQVVTSDGWKLFQQTSREIQTLPNRLMREAAVEDLKNATGQVSPPAAADSRLPASRTAQSAAPPQAPSPAAPNEGEPTILPTAPRTDRGDAAEDRNA